MHIDRLQTIEAADDTIGGRMSLARDAANLSIETVAGSLGIPPDIWAIWENDRAEPFAESMERIAGTLAVSLTWLSSGHGRGPSWPG
jgi:transcriptional regulator with XRE-family HTH domain